MEHMHKGDKLYLKTNNKNAIKISRRTSVFIIVSIIIVLMNGIIFNTLRQFSCRKLIGLLEISVT